MKKRFLILGLIIAIICIALFIGKNIFYKATSNVPIPSSVPEGTLDSKSISPTLTKIKEVFDLRTFAEGESPNRTFVNQSNDLVVFFKMLTDIAHQARNPTYDILLNQNRVGEIVGQGIVVTGFSPDNKYFAFRTRSVTGCSGICQDFNAFVVDITTRKVIQIPFPSSMEGLVNNPVDFIDIIQFININNWQDNKSLQVTSYLVGIDKNDGNAYRISPIETLNYDLSTEQYTPTEALTE